WLQRRAGQHGADMCDATPARSATPAQGRAPAHHRRAVARAPLAWPGQMRIIPEDMVRRAPETVAPGGPPRWLVGRWLDSQESEFLLSGLVIPAVVFARPEKQRASGFS